MKFNELEVSANKPRRRIGRGISAGQGKTAGRGTKGQNARTGKTARPGFAGGQSPMMQALPKLRGFKPFWESAVSITTDQISGLKGTITTDALYKARLIDSPYRTVRLVLGKQEVKSAHKVELQAASASVITKLEKAGGSFKKVPKPAREAKKSTEK